MKPEDLKGFVHGEEDCTPPCAIHAPSSHHMVDWPLNLRDSGLLERICEHGVGHPDPDSLAYLVNADEGNSCLGIHGCDLCCMKPEKRNEMSR